MPLNSKMATYVEARVAGADKLTAARSAGYSENGLDAAVSRLESRADVQAAIRAGRKTAGAAGGSGGRAGQKPAKNLADDDGVPLMKAKYGSSLELMQDTYNNPRMPPAMRFEAAKQALPYEHGKVGETGKKETAKNRAKEIAAGKGGSDPSRFRKKAPPRLRIVAGGK